MPLQQLKDDGSVVTWGTSLDGGAFINIASQLSSSAALQLSSGVINIYTTSYAFAALKDDGSVVTWGSSLDGGDSSSVASPII